jgi:hypothetical protein
MQQHSEHTENGTGAAPSSAPAPLVPATLPQDDSLQSIEERLAGVMRNPGSKYIEALTVLGAAALSGQEETIRSLVVHHSKGVNETNGDGQTAAHAA